MQRLILATLVIASAGALAQAGNGSTARFWTDNTGDFTVRAELAELDREAITLKLSSGDLIQVSLRRLSPADHAWLKRNDHLQQPQSAEIAGIQWLENLKDAQRMAAGSDQSTDDKPIMCFRALGDLAGFM